MHICPKRIKETAQLNNINEKATKGEQTDRMAFICYNLGKSVTMSQFRSFNAVLLQQCNRTGAHKMPHIHTSIGGVHKVGVNPHCLRWFSPR